MNSRELLADTAPFMPPALVLEHLSVEDAERRLPGASHSIAEIVAHLAFWQHWFGQRAQSTGVPMPAHAQEGWPTVDAGGWPHVRARFLSGFEQWRALDSAPAQSPVLAPPLEHPVLAHYSAHDVLVHIALHNAHHMGQVVLLRQLMGCWPPPSGSWTW